LLILRLLILRTVLRLLLVLTVVCALRGRRHGPLRRGLRTVIAGIVVAAAVLIDLRIVAIDVAIDNFVVYTRAIVAAG
jgi:hypothetical protein